MKGPWKTEFRCRGCRKSMSFYVMMNSHGTCPMCGHTCRSTVCDTYSVAFRFVKTGPWWKIWSWEKELKND